ncbi:MAG: ISNCY family transposase ISVisp7 [Syntrophus sp. SKADARSKE-3]|nr:ISNCY family transposase ISVisp7 [Syntrophus sp. SKADARSKE-3]MDQ5984526.1 ISNCY family transposase ISVisp7 [Syntrophus sp. SKADARSKE-3]MDQ5984789.1 ISNCY family transposase ISVisp7 [Syntrophus sp. SKADARSKE-3]MDQ5984895.1 ISNCY family transposase ISVisp7 [Syntrophus sp. SKADARSKE-3]MDQ5985258.1 ISNCY family transposase ISVisp7 [Syntrophus sp. SKADARSKE-3]
MRQTEMLQEIRRMRFEEVYSEWNESRLTEEEAARILGVSDRTFRRYIDRYDHFGVDGLSDKRLTQASFRRAPVDEVMAVTDRYKNLYRGWNVKHFYSKYQKDGGKRSYSWVKNTLQSSGVVPKVSKRGVHRKRRDRSPLPGMMVHQDGSTHEWVPGKKWDLIVTMDDATNEHYSMFFVDEEGTASSFQGVRDVIVQRGLFSSLYTDRGSHYWFTPKEGGKVSKTQLTQFGRAMRQLGIQMIAAYSPEARGRSERAFLTHQDRLPKELALHRITEMDAANRYLAEEYKQGFNTEFMYPSTEEGSAFIPWVGANLDDILCQQEERTVNADNCVCVDGFKLQIPANKYRCHYVRVRVMVHRYRDGSLAIFHGSLKLADYDKQGKHMEVKTKKAA